MAIYNTSAAGHVMRPSVTLLLKNDEFLYKPIILCFAGYLVHILGFLDDLLLTDWFSDRIVNLSPFDGINQVIRLSPEIRSSGFEAASNAIATLS